MRQDILKKYTTLRSRLEKERAKLRATLAGIEAALGSEAPMPAVRAEAPVKRKRRMSAAGRAAVKAAAKARWAAFRAKQGGQAAPKAARKAKKHFSAAARAALSAAAKARWKKAKTAGKARL